MNSEVAVTVPAAAPAVVDVHVAPGSNRTAATDAVPRPRPVIVTAGFAVVDK